MAVKRRTSKKPKKKASKKVKKTTSRRAVKRAPGKKKAKKAATSKKKKGIKRTRSNRENPGHPETPTDRHGKKLKWSRKTYFNYTEGVKVDEDGWSYVEKKNKDGSTRRVYKDKQAPVWPEKVPFREGWVLGQPNEEDYTHIHCSDGEDQAYYRQVLALPIPKKKKKKKRGKKKRKLTKEQRLMSRTNKYVINEIVRERKIKKKARRAREKADCIARGVPIVYTKSPSEIKRRKRRKARKKRKAMGLQY